MQHQVSHMRHIFGKHLLHTQIIQMHRPDIKQNCKPCHNQHFQKRTVHFSLDHSSENRCYNQYGYDQHGTIIIIDIFVNDSHSTSSFASIYFLHIRI